MAETCPVPETKEIDIYRDTPVRLLGYANEVGEAFRALVSVKFVIGTYGVASAYVLADTYDKASKVSIRFERETKILGLSLAFYMKFSKIGFTILPHKNEPQIFSRKSKPNILSSLGRPCTKKLSFVLLRS